MTEELGTTGKGQVPMWKSSGSQGTAWACWDVLVGEKRSYLYP
jgi:hypothetical protein